MTRDKRQRITRISRTLLLLLMMMVVGTTGAWGQTPDYSGVYYIGSHGYVEANTTSNYYLCPTEKWYYYISSSPYHLQHSDDPNNDNGQPFMTTYQCRNGNGSYNATKAVWIVEKQSNGYYHIKRKLDGKYLTYNVAMGNSSNAGRMRVHLEATADGDNALFTLTKSGDYYNIITKNYGPGNDRKYLNVTDGNKPSLQASGKTDGPKTDGTNAIAVGGIIGLWTSGTENTSKWYFEVPKPVISQGSDKTISISHQFGEDVKIYYTTDGTNPTTSSTPYTGAFLPEINKSQIKAIATNTNKTVQSAVETLDLEPCPLPSITYDNETKEITISSTLSGATVYYTKAADNPSDPNFDTETHSTDPITIPNITSKTVIKAFAAKQGYAPSAIKTQTVDKVAPPVFDTSSGNSLVITCATEGATIYYTDDNSEPSTSWSVYRRPITDGISGKSFRAFAVKANNITSDVAGPSTPITLRCTTPVIKRGSGNTFTLSCGFPTEGVTIYYTTNGADLVANPTSGTAYTVNTEIPFTGTSVTVKAIAVADGYNNSTLAERTITEALAGSGTEADPYLIESPGDFDQFVTKANDTGSGDYYKVTGNFTVNSTSAITKEFTGTFDGDGYTISGLGHALFNTVNGGTVKNVIFESVNISSGDSDGDAGAVCCKAEGTSRIYNCGILPTTVNRDTEGNVTGFSGSSVSGTRYVGGLVGMLSGTARVINCYSYANVSGGTMMGGIVGNNTVATTADATDTDHYLKTMVMNCMFYGNITGGSRTTMKPVYGGEVISNAGATGINGYNYYRNGKDVTFDDDYSGFADYYCSLPADEEYLTRFEYYRSILNSNRQLCTYWVTDKKVTDTEDPTKAQTAADTALIAKWVLDPSIAPYPILKKWGKYPSVINPDKEYVWNPKTQQMVRRTAAEPYQGKLLGTISVTVNAGAKHAGDGETSKLLSSVIVMDMDTLNHDYGYAKIQLPYYNELFGDPTADAATQWDKRYGGNYKEYVVTGWKITAVSGGTPGSFKGYAVTSVPTATSNVSAGTVTPDVTSTSAWEDGFNFADRTCTNKDLYSKSGRVFAQGGYYYVPENVTSITIEAYWGKAVYLHNKDHSLDRVNVASGGQGNGADFGTSFSPAGTLPTKFQNIDVQTTLQQAISALTLVGTDYTVYDQAIVLVGNVQVKNRSDAVGDNNTSNRRPFTIMSIDEDMDNEPDYCLEFQFRNGTDRPGIHPIRFDFLPVPELGLTIRTNTFGYTIGVFIPQGHFEITETAFMHTTQFEYDGNVNRVESPIILNGGHFEQIVVRYGPKNKVSYFLLGGHFRMKRFTPGYHANNGNPIAGGNVRHCVVNAIGGDYPEFYLSGIYRPDWTVNKDNPHCYINGGRFGTLAGAGYEQVDGDVTFKIDHAIIDEFYGGGINAAKPVTGKIEVTINNSLVDKYCGGPKVGQMTEVSSGVLKTVTTNATGTTFGVFYGGGNGGTSYYRESKFDNTGSFPAASSGWSGFTAFNPLNQKSDVNAAYKNSETENWGYHAEYEFEVFNSSNGLKSGEDVLRCYYLWAQFGTTTTGNVTSTLTDCTVKGDFFGGGNLANVTGNVTSTLKGNTHIYGSAYAAGFSASIPSFPVHDKGTVSIPTQDAAGNVAEQGSLDYYKDGGENRKYTWCYKNASGKVFPEGVEIPAGYSAGTKQKSVFKYPNTEDGKWYVLTTESLEGLGAVNGNAEITLDENCVIDGSVYGGGDSSAVNGNTTVELKGDAHVEGNVFGGGNNGEVSGSTKVNIEYSE